MSSNAAAEARLRFLRALAFEIHRKRPPAEAMVECIEREGQRGRHRLLRPVSAVLEAEGVVPALKAANFVGDEAAAVLAAVMEAGDHRLVAAALNALADYHEAQ